MIRGAAVASISMLRAVPLLLLVLAGCIADEPPAAAPSEPTVPWSDTGEWPDGEQVLADLKDYVATAPRRYDNQFQHDAARDWIESAWTDAGLDVERQTFTGAAQVTGTTQGQNLIATVPGGEPIIVLGAHYDSAVTAYEAAYDDGTGTMLVVELARAMATHTWNHTLVFVAFDQEEAGLVGSSHHAQSLRDADAPVVLMLNFDMVGMNWPAQIGGALPQPIDGYFGGTDEARFASAWSEAARRAGFPAEATTTQTGLGTGSSDHGSYRAADYDAGWIRGALIGDYPAYHNGDTVAAMTLAVGGDEADLVAGFQAVLDLIMHFVQVVDEAA